MYLKIERGLSDNSIENYSIDVKAFQNFLKRKKINQTPLSCNEETVKHFIYQSSKILSPHTQARRIAGLRSFFDYLIFEEYRKNNPTDLIEAPKLGRCTLLIPRRALALGSKDASPISLGRWGDKRPMLRFPHNRGRPPCMSIRRVNSRTKPKSTNT